MTVAGNPMRQLRSDIRHLKRLLAKEEENHESTRAEYQKLLDHERELTVRLSARVTDVMGLFIDEVRQARAATWAAFMHELRAELLEEDVELHAECDRLMTEFMCDGDRERSQLQADLAEARAAAGTERDLLAERIGKRVLACGIVDPDVLYTPMRSESRLVLRTIAAALRHEIGEPP